jgi:hypothetical protein
MAQAALGPRAGRTLAITGGFEFGNKASLLVLMKSTCDLPHHDARRIAIVGQVVAVGRQFQASLSRSKGRAAFQNPPSAPRLNPRRGMSRNVKAPVPSG